MLQVLASCAPMLARSVEIQYHSLRSNKVSSTVLFPRPFSAQDYLGMHVCRPKQALTSGERWKQRQDEYRGSEFRRKDDRVWWIFSCRDLKFCEVHVQVYRTSSLMSEPERCPEDL